MEGLVLLELEGFDPFDITFDDVCALLLLFIPNEKDNKNDSVSYKIIRSKTEWGRKTGCLAHPVSYPAWTQPK